MYLIVPSIIFLYCTCKICDILKGSLLVKETPVAVKVARLYLLSDILYNSAAPVKYASHYRSVQRRKNVPLICTGLCNRYTSLSSLLLLRFLFIFFEHLNACI